MINLLAYHLLLLCCLGSLFMGKRWVLYAMALMAPMTQTMPGPYGFMLSPVNAILLGLGGLMLRADAEDRSAGRVLNLRIMSAWTLIVAVGVARTLLNPPSDLGYLIDPVEVAKTGWYWTTPFIIYFMVYRLVATRDLARQIIMLCMASSVLEAMLAMYERLQGVGRATAHLAEPNRAGAYFAGASVLMFAFVLLEKGRPRILFLVGWILAMGALFATLSRGGMLASGVGSLVVFMAFLLYYNQKGVSAKFKYVVLLILLASNLFLVLPQRVVDRLLITVHGDPRENVGMEKTGEMDSSAEERLLLWTVGLRLFREQPYGHGAYTATTLQARYRGSTKAMHNIYLQILVEHGLQGLLCLLVLIGAVGRNLWRGFRRRQESVEESALFLGLFGYWVALCAAHFFVNPFFMLQLNGQFWVMSACAFGYGARRRDTE